MPRFGCRGFPPRCALLGLEHVEGHRQAVLVAIGNVGDDVRLLDRLGRAWCVGLQRKPLEGERLGRIIVDLDGHQVAEDRLDVDHVAPLDFFRHAHPGKRLPGLGRRAGVGVGRVWMLWIDEIIRSRQPRSGYG